MVDPSNCLNSTAQLASDGNMRGVIHGSARGGGGCKLASTKRASHVKEYAVPATSGPAARAVPVPNTTLLALTVRVWDAASKMVADSVPELAPKWAVKDNTQAW